MSLPVIGAALTLETLPPHLPWLLDKQRDLELQDFIDIPTLTGDWQPRVDALHRLLDGHTGRRGLHGPFFGFMLDGYDPEIQAIAAKRIDTALDICAALDADLMVLHSPFSNWDYHNFGNNPRGLEVTIERCEATLRAAVARARALGIALAVENIEDVDPLHRRALVEALGADVVKLSIDTGHAHYAHSATGAPPVDYFVGAAEGLLAHVHLQDVDGYADRHWALGEGTMPWAAVFRALGRIEDTPRLILEMRDAADVPVSMRFLEAQGLGQ